jgi:oxygen-dependent protoporphyrinogen oxidase
MGQLIRALAEPLANCIRTQTAVTRIERIEPRGFAPPDWRVVTSRGDEVTTGSLFLALPAWEAAKLFRWTDPELSDLLAGIPSVPVGVVHLGFRNDDLGRPPRGFGILVPSRERSPLLGVIAASNVFPNRAPDGHTLMTAMMGGARAPEILDLDDEALTQRALAALDPLIGIRGAPRLTRVIRHRHGIPQYTIGHADRLAAVTKRAESIRLIGNSYRGVSVGAAVEDALPEL